MPPQIMVSLDPNNYWERNANYVVQDLAKEKGGCRDFKLHVPFPSEDLHATIRLIWAMSRSSIYGPPTILIDDKHFDISTTVVMRLRNVFGMGVSHVTVHASGGRTMLQSAVKEASSDFWGGVKKTIVSVLVPTSMLEEEVVESFGTSRKETLERFAVVSMQSGIEDIVCGVPDIPIIRNVLADFPKKPRLWAVGIRPTWHTDAGSQVVTGTHIEASRLGAFKIISGSAILVPPQKDEVFKPRERFDRMNCDMAT